MLSFALMSRVFPSALSAVAYSRGIVALASIASPAVIFPAVRDSVKIVPRIASEAFTVVAFRLPTLAVEATICRPSSVSPAAISPWETVTASVLIPPSESMWIR